MEKKVNMGRKEKMKYIRKGKRIIGKKCWGVNEKNAKENNTQNTRDGEKKEKLGHTNTEQEHKIFVTELGGTWATIEEE